MPLEREDYKGHVIEVEEPVATATGGQRTTMRIDGRDIEVEISARGKFWSRLHMFMEYESALALARALIDGRRL
jgi:hypothetical protein